METIFRTILPGWKGAGLPTEFPFHVRFVLKASVLIAHFYAILTYGLPFGMLNEEKREKIMHKLYYHSNPSIRNTVQFWKMTAFMTHADQ